VLPVENHSNWMEFYPDASEEITKYLPPEKGPRVRMTVYVDADHAHDLVTRRSITGLIEGNGDSMKAIKVGSLKCHVIQLYGSSVNLALKEVKYVPELWVNFFCISKALKNGFNLSNKGLMISLKKGSVCVTFIESSRQ
jgi:hypothetical protein